jgi:hypothetical protein
MCEYSLHAPPNRLPDEGEELVLRRFETGTLGFASASDVAGIEQQSEKEEPDSLWRAIKALLSPEKPPRLREVCIPPGTRLLLNNVPDRVQKSLCMACSELAEVTEISSRSYSYRDALLLPNGTRVLLQDLPEGIHVVVLSLSPEAPETRVGAEMCAG